MKQGEPEDARHLRQSVAYRQPAACTKTEIPLNRSTNGQLDSAEWHRRVGPYAAAPPAIRRDGVCAIRDYHRRVTAPAMASERSRRRYLLA